MLRVIRRRAPCVIRSGVADLACHLGVGRRAAPHVPRRARVGVRVPPDVRRNHVPKLSHHQKTSRMDVGVL